jgi:uncharacterized protein (UPF0333 family)
MLIKRLLGNNRGNAFLEYLLIILLMVMVIAIPAYGLAEVIGDNIVVVVDRVNQIGIP